MLPFSSLLLQQWNETYLHYHKVDPKQTYYLSMEFLQGRALTNAIRNLDIQDAYSSALNKLGHELEEITKQEMAVVRASVGLSVTPVIEKAVTTPISEVFQRGIGDKAINQLEKIVNTKLEATVSRQIQVQFQTSGKQALQEALKSSMEASVLPAYEMSCKTILLLASNLCQITMEIDRCRLIASSGAYKALVESVLSKIMEELENRITSQVELVKLLSYVVS
ncbi:unnamed protein product [Lactuca saligna]|uniref:Uncharacterized protein n=1 Tax=Lactuca saligna TaxID=75948 RepID=A0AA36EPD7_LACSI|nr:unnamed protein product [Lactuca saligna]